MSVMYSLNDLLKKLDNRHSSALTWFLIKKNKVISWPDKLINGDLVCTKAKAIYKPAWSKYALSVYETLDGPYPDKEPIFRSNGTWQYEYYQEGEGINDFDKHYVNIAMQNNMEDRIPVGVMRQVKRKPNPEYLVLGIAYPVAYKNGWFVLEGVNDAGIAHIK